MTEWNTFAESRPENGRRFIALYSDGSGSQIFYGYDCGMIDQDGDDRYIDDIDNGDFFYWSYLPDNFKMWCEVGSVDPLTIEAMKNDS